MKFKVLLTVLMNLGTFGYQASSIAQHESVHAAERAAQNASTQPSIQANETCGLCSLAGQAVVPWTFAPAVQDPSPVTVADEPTPTYAPLLRSWSSAQPRAPPALSLS